MFIAEIELPKIVERKVFDKLKENYEHLEIDVTHRVKQTYDSNYDIMSEDEYYKDECVKDGVEWYNKDNEPVPYYNIHERPTKDVIVMANNNLIINLEEFYQYMGNVVPVKILRYVPVNDYSTQRLYEAIEKLIKIMESIKSLDKGNTLW